MVDTKTQKAKAYWQELFELTDYIDQQITNLERAQQ